MSSSNVLNSESVGSDLIILRNQKNKLLNHEAGATEKYCEDGISKDFGKIEGINRLTGVTVSDVHRVSRKAEESASRRFQATSWLQKVVGHLEISDEPSEEELRLCLRNGLVLCNLVRKIHPGAIPKIVENPAALSPPDGAHFVFQYFENVRNFLVAMEELKLPSFEASDLEQGGLVAGSMVKVVDCILTLKSYFEWKESGGIGSWKYRNTSKYGTKPSPPGSLGISFNIAHQYSDLYSSTNSNSDTSDFDFKQEDKMGADFNDDMFTKNDSNSTAWNQQIGQKLREALQKADSKSFSILVRTLLTGKNLEEVPMLVEFFLNSAADEFEQQLALQRKQLQKLRIASKELLRREDRLLSRLKALEALVIGSGEEMKLVTHNLQLIKIEKEEIETEKKMQEELVRKLSEEKEEQQMQVERLKNQVESSTRKADETKLELELHKRLELESKMRIKELMLELELSVKNGQEIQEAMEIKLSNLREDYAKFQDRVSLQLPAFQNIKSIVDATRQNMLNMNVGWQEEMDALQSKLEGITGAATGYYKVQAENRTLYNEVEELKVLIMHQQVSRNSVQGKIRVYCRVRPFQSSTQGIVDFIGENGDILIRNPIKQGRDGQKLFKFNKVYKSSASQDEIFLDSQQLIRSVLDGFNVCIFAYGQTGSGKTYTMTGPSSSLQEDWGINYRSLNDLFQTSYSRKDFFHYEVGVQMIEIYNEQVRDLLANDGTKRNLKIWNNSQHNGLHVPDANFVVVKSTEDVLELIKIGQRNRTIGATALNEHSSRSHSVLIVHVQGTDLISRSILRGRLHLVDLAGSERVVKSEAIGDRLKEAQHINESLSALGDVIAALAQKGAHVPYRNSKLTQLLQDSLGGHARTIIFMHISQDSESYGETLSTLKFGERVTSIELGAARSNRESSEVRDLREQIASLQEALVRKNAEIGKRDSEIERLQTLKVVRTSGASQSSPSGKKTPKDSKHSPGQRMSISEANTPRNPKHLLEMMAYREVQLQEALSISARQLHEGPFLSETALHNSESDFEVRVKTEEKFAIPRVMHKRSVSIDSQTSIASTKSNNHTQRKVQRELILDREANLKEWKDRVHKSSDTLLASVAGDYESQQWNANDSPNVGTQINAYHSLQKESNPVNLRSHDSSTAQVKSSKHYSKFQWPDNSQTKKLFTHERPEKVGLNDQRVCLQNSSQKSDMQGDFEDKSSEKSGLSQETDTDVSAVTSCEHPIPFTSDNRTSKGAEMRSLHHTKIPRPPFRNILKLSNDSQSHVSNLRRPLAMASDKGSKASSSYGLRSG